MRDRFDPDNKPDDVRALPPARGRTSMRKRQMALTAQERQILLAELAEIAAELDEMQERTAQLVARVTRRSTVRLARPA